MNVFLQLTNESVLVSNERKMADKADKKIETVSFEFG